MKSELEIERKFLVRMPELEKLDIIRRIDMIQTYLSDGKNGSQRRVRKTVCENDISMIYTEKVFISPMVREESEKTLTAEEYSFLLADAKDTSPVEKTRIVFSYCNQNFEMDIYPFSDKYAVLELELNNPGQKIIFPDYIDVIKEVTGNKLYSNIVLANAGKFPENL